jgi:hypothetical protein
MKKRGYIVPPKDRAQAKERAAAVERQEMMRAADANEPLPTVRKETEADYPLGSLETVMEASLCPMCSQALKISTIEPHETRDGVDVVTRRCPIHGDIWRSVVVNEVEAADTGHRDAAAATTT